jgi:hypothetical protein
MDDCELITLVTAVACAISKNCSENDISILSAVFSQLGDTLATVLTNRELKESGGKSDKNEAPTPTIPHTLL